MTLNVLPLAAVLSLFASLFASEAFANCYCRCVDGASRPVCTNNLEVPPICSQQNCAVAPSVQPVQPLDQSIGGSPMCDSVEVFNRRTGRWETRPVCR